MTGYATGMLALRDARIQELERMLDQRRQLAMELAERLAALRGALAKYAASQKRLADLNPPEAELVMVPAITVCEDVLEILRLDDGAPNVPSARAVTL